MKNTIVGVIIGLALAMGGYGLFSWLEQENQFDVNALPPYSNAFNKESNSSSDLILAMKKAKREQKNILLIAGGNWCRWCGTMENFLEANPKLQKAFYTKFELLRVYYGKGMNQTAKKLLRSYPKPKGTPHFYVLDPQAKLLHSFNTKALERGYSYNRTKFEAFIEKYSKLKFITKDNK